MGVGRRRRRKRRISIAKKKKKLRKEPCIQSKSIWKCLYDSSDIQMATLDVLGAAREK